MTTFIHDAAGRILCQANAPVAEAAHLLRPGDGLVESSGGETAVTHYVEDGALVAFPPSPGKAFEWDWATRSFKMTGAATAAVRGAKKLEIEAIAEQLSGAPVAYGGSLFDADAAAITNISGVTSRIARGDGLPAGWLGWRSADNQQVWAELSAGEVLVNLRALSVLIEDRRQAILAAKWVHKDAIEAADALTVESYDVTANWPV